MRASGILMHISSLPNACGIGKLGREAYDFVDFLEKASQTYWQVLPVSPTSYGDSPYQSFSVFAGNPYFIDFKTLENDGLLKASEYESVNWGTDLECVDYGLLYKNIFPVLKKAYARFKKSPESGYEAFLSQNGWLDDYALFMSLKFAHNGAAWYEWEEPLRLYKADAVSRARLKYADDIGFWKFLQYEYFKQWNALKKYANEKGIKIIGDIPIYVALDSTEVWTRPELFMLDSDKRPTFVAGCPPDCFSPLGQLWGNPLYRWDEMECDGYSWWISRIAFAAKVYDKIRIDHFRGFDSFYAIPYGSADATVGEWKQGAGMKLFKAVKQSLGEIDVIAEDLGFITKSVERLLKRSGYPGMKVLEFAFDKSGESVYLPHNFKDKNCVVYTGTHDNETLGGWVKSQSRADLAFCREYLGVKRNRDIPWAMLRLAWSSIADTAIAQMQDFLELDNCARMNTPSTLGGNWTWRMKYGAASDALAQKIARLTKTYGRTPNKPNERTKR